MKFFLQNVKDQKQMVLTIKDDTRVEDFVKLLVSKYKEEAKVQSMIYMKVVYKGKFVTGDDEHRDDLISQYFLEKNPHVQIVVDLIEIPKQKRIYLLPSGMVLVVE